jgi:hypothetical protein
MEAPDGEAQPDMPELPEPGAPPPLLIGEEGRMYVDGALRELDPVVAGEMQAALGLAATYRRPRRCSRSSRCSA